MSHPVTSRLLNTVGDGHDAKVKEWRDTLTDSIKSTSTEEVSLIRSCL